MNAPLRGAARGYSFLNSLRNQFGIQLPVLLYHHVGPPRPGTISNLTVSPEKFERNVRWLARKGFVGIRPSAWLRWLRNGAALPNKPILLTFDDGYADLSDYALPVLRRYGFSGAVYIVTGRLGATNTWDEEKGSGTHRLMTAEQIRYWATRGIEFGAHSRTHPDLTKLSAAQLAAEIFPVHSFAYPCGKYNADWASRSRTA